MSVAQGDSGRAMKINEVWQPPVAGFLIFW